MMSYFSVVIQISAIVMCCCYLIEHHFQGTKDSVVTVKHTSYRHLALQFTYFWDVRGKILNSAYKHTNTQSGLFSSS